MEHAGVETLRCPQGETLVRIVERRHHGPAVIRYEAAQPTCAHCDKRDQCCPTHARRGRRVERVVESEAMQAYHRRMAQPAMQALYKTRAERAEFPNLWIKGYWKIRRFSVRGLAKAAKEALWYAISYNLQQWIRIQRALSASA